MLDMDVKPIRTFPAVDAEGNTYTIRVYRELVFLPATPFRPDRFVESPRMCFELDDGVHVEWLRRGAYRVGGSNVILKSDSPAAD